MRTRIRRRSRLIELMIEFEFDSILVSCFFSCRSSGSIFGLDLNGLFECSTSLTDADATFNTLFPFAIPARINSFLTSDVYSLT